MATKKKPICLKESYAMLTFADFSTFLLRLLAPDLNVLYLPTFTFREKMINRRKMIVQNVLL